MKSTKISSPFPKRGDCNAKRTEKHKNKMTQAKIKNKWPVSTTGRYMIVSELIQCLVSIVHL